MHSEPVLMTLGQTDLPLSVSGTSQCLINPYLDIIFFSKCNRNVNFFCYSKSLERINVY